MDNANIIIGKQFWPIVIYASPRPSSPLYKTIMKDTTIKAVDAKIKATFDAPSRLLSRL